MTIKYITTYIAGGYTLSSKYSALIIEPTGGVGGSGLAVNFLADVTNLGKVSGPSVGSGVAMQAGGSLLNGSLANTVALIEGGSGVSIANAPGTVTNYGSIVSSRGNDSVFLANGGSVTNGTATERSALLQGNVFIQNGNGNVTNFGTIISVAMGAPVVGLTSGTVINSGTAALLEGGFGVNVEGTAGLVSNTGSIFGGPGTGIGVEIASGKIVNGAAGYTAALVKGGYDGVLCTNSSSVYNFGTIVGTDSAAKNAGVALGGGGFAVNGTAEDSTALITGATAVEGYGAVATITNYGSITGTADQGVDLSAGGRVTNGAGTDHAALIEGSTGIAIAGGAGSVINFGAIEGLSSSGAQSGVYLADGGVVTNGGGVDRTALIEGESGVPIAGAAGTIRNLGTLLGNGGSNTYGASLFSGSITNGSVNNATALIEGYGGVELISNGLAVNLGTIAGLGDYSGAGVYLQGAGGALVNGGGGHAGALIEGYVGVRAQFYATVTNYGTIEGASGVALQFAYFSPNRDVPNPNHDLLNIKAGSAFIGAVKGGGGTINLASGTGTISNFAGGDLTVSGSMAVTPFTDFYTVEVASGARFTDTGAVTIVTGQTLDDSGILALGGAGAARVVNAGLIETTGAGVMTLVGAVTSTGTLAADGGTLIVTGAVTGNGAATINGGTLDLASSFNQAVTFAGTTGVLELAQSQAYTAKISGFSTTGSTSLDLVDIGFVSSSEATYSGTKTGGVLTVTDGTHTAHINLKGNYLSSTFVASSDGHGGTIVVDPKGKGGPAPVSSLSPHPLIAAMASLRPQAGTGWASHVDAATGQPFAAGLIAPRVALA